MTTPTPETKVWLALKAQVESMSLSPAHQIAYQISTSVFVPPTSNNKPVGYVRVAFVPNTVEPVTLGDTGKNRHVGILQITAVEPKLSDVTVVTEIAGDIADHFKIGTEMTYSDAIVRIVRPPTSPGILSSAEAPMSEVPVIIRWQADVPRT